MYQAGLYFRMHQFVLLSILVFIIVSINAQPESTSEKRGDPVRYWVTFSTKLRSGTSLQVNVHLVQPGVTSTVHVALTNHSNASIIFAEAQPQLLTGGDQTHVINLEIPRTLKNPRNVPYYNYFRYAVRVIASGDVNFNESEVVTLEEKSFSVFIQTDKAVYKPGQTVKFRALAMYPNLTILHQPMDVFIKDPKGNGIRYWGGVTGIGNTGVIELSMPTSTQPLFGDWTIEVSLLDSVEIKTFTINEYVLPTYDVQINTLKNVLAKDGVIQGSASAKYSFGKPLSSAEITLKVKFQSYSSRAVPELIKQGKLDSKGELKFTFTKDTLKDLLWDTVYKERYSSSNYRTVVITANVTDTLTDEIRTAEELVTLHTELAKIEFLPISSTYFKPGLDYTAYVKVTKFDDSLFENPGSINVQFHVTISVPRIITTTTTTTTASPLTNQSASDSESEDNGQYVPPPYIPEDEIVLVTENRVLTETGLIPFDVIVPEHASWVDFRVTVLDKTENQRAYKTSSPSDTFLQIQLQTQKPQVGDTAVFLIRTTEFVKILTSQVYSKGVILSSSEITSTEPNGSQEFTVSLKVTASMTPNVRLLVFYFRSDGEVVADSMSVRVDGSNENPVSVSFSQKQVKPGAQVNLNIGAKPDSTVFILGVDKRVQQFKSGNDITPDLVSQELIGYDFGFGYHSFWHYMDRYWWPYYGSAYNADGVFKDAKVALFTDGTGYIVTKFEPYYSYHSRGLVGRQGIMSANYKIAASEPLIGRSPTGASMDVPVERIRKFFPETWLWDLFLVGSDEEQISQPVTAPDTITTWLITAFAVHPEHGLSVIPKAAELTTFRDIFVNLALPSSVVRNEVVCFSAFAFNYHSKPQSMTVTLGQNKDISNVRVICQGRTEVVKPARVVHRLGVVTPDTVRETAFCLKPTGLGEISINVNLTTTSALGDGVEQHLLVKPEGLPRSQSIPVILDVASGQLFSRSVPIQFPDNAVDGSQRISIKVAGDLLGPVMKSIDLLRLPYGCAEQNMLYFGPNVYLIKYLQTIGAYTPQLATTAENYMLTGYQKQITYQYNDGSYGSFGHTNGKNTGSIWLTAFVTKCFIQSMALKNSVVAIDTNVVSKAIFWMISQQTETGSFNEPGIVFNKALQGGSGEGEARTAYVLIALLEANINFEGLANGVKEKLQSAIPKAIVRLENRLPHLEDSYDLAIVTYALHLAGSDQAETAFNRLVSKAVKEQLTVHWERPSLNPEPVYYYWQRLESSLNIEMTAWALLTYAFRKDVTGALPIIRWLTTQRGSEGGFISTQDTVTALQALSEIAVFIYSPKLIPIKVNLSWTVGGKLKTSTVTIDESTKFLVQEVEVNFKNSPVPSHISVNASTSGEFTGFAVADVALYYNVKETTNFTTYYLPTPEVTMTDPKSFILTIVCSRIDGEVGGMTVLEVEPPSGFELDTSNAEYSFTGLKLEKTEDGTYTLYYEELGPSHVEVVLPMHTSGTPVNLQPSYVKLYEYYDNAGRQQATASYELPLLKSNSVCDLTSNYECCPPSRKRP